jgi:ADP-heptose:LPS heptosyltransferase
MRGLGFSDFNAAIPSLPKGELPYGFTLSHYFVLFPGAGVHGRQWPLVWFRELGRRTFELTGLPGVVCGGPDDEGIASALCVGASFPLFNWTGKTSLSELIAIIGGARLLIGNETSAVHIAAAAGTPSVCITGGGHYGRFVPYRLEVSSEKPEPKVVAKRMDCFYCNWQCVHQVKEGGPFPCIEKVSPDMVWDAVSQMLSQEL